MAADTQVGVALYNRIMRPESSTPPTLAANLRRVDCVIKCAPHSAAGAGRMTLPAAIRLLAGLRSLLLGFATETLTRLVQTFFGPKSREYFGFLRLMSPGKIRHRGFVPNVIDGRWYQVWKRAFNAFNHAFHEPAQFRSFHSQFIEHFHVSKLCFHSGRERTRRSRQLGHRWGRCGFVGQHSIKKNIKIMIKNTSNWSISAGSHTFRVDYR